MSVGHIFISYRSTEVDFALKLAADLKNSGVNIWLDRLDAGIKVGDDWVQSLQDALDNCGSIIAILSPDYVESKYCRRELKRADSYDRPIYPLLLSQLDDKKWPLEIQEKQYIDFRQWHDETIYQQQFKNLITVLTDQAPLQFGQVPDNETRYLTSLISELESRKGVLEYVELSTHTDIPTDNEPVRPEPRHDEWAAGFSMLVDRTKNTERNTKQNSTIIATEKITFNSIIEVKDKFPSFVLIGEPGAGKSTTLRWIALEAARKRLENPNTSPLPLLVNLPKWENELTPLDFIRKHWPFNSDLAKLLVQGTVLLFLDGLNEMGAGRYEKAQKLTKWLESTEAPKYVFVTCRSGDYVGRMKLGDIPTVIVDEMKERHIREFAHRYLGENAGLFLSRLVSDKMPNKDFARSLHKLAQNPYLLSALIFLFQNSTDSDLPNNHSELMYDLVQALWKRENIKQTVGWIPFEKMREKMTNLAFAMIDESKPTDVAFDYAIKHLKDKNLVAACHSANLIMVQGNTLRFYHQIIQEFFAAFHKLVMPKRLKKIQFAITYDKWGYKKVIVKESKWNQVIILLCGLQQYPDSMIEDIAKINPMLAVDCITSGVSIEHTTVQTIVKILTDIISSSQIKTYVSMTDYHTDNDSITSTEVATSIGVSIGISLIFALLKIPFIFTLYPRRRGSRLSDLVPKELEEEYAEEKEILVRHLHELGLVSLSRLNYQESITALIDTMASNSRYMRRSAARSLNRISNWEQNEFNIEPRSNSYIYTLLDDDDVNVRLSAIKLLGLIREESAVPKLAHLLLNDPSTNNANARGLSDVALNALENIGTSEAIKVVEKWREKH